jgi:hypothetical protein
MNTDLRKYNGGARQGAGRPKTVSGYHQVAVRLPEDMANWVLRKAIKACGGSEAELLRRLIRAAMEQETPPDVTKS